MVNVGLVSMLIQFLLLKVANTYFDAASAQLDTDIDQRLENTGEGLCNQQQLTQPIIAKVDTLTAPSDTGQPL